MDLVRGILVFLLTFNFLSFSLNLFSIEVYILNALFKIIFLMYISLAIKDSISFIFAIYAIKESLQVYTLLFRFLSSFIFKLVLCQIVCMFDTISRGNDRLEKLKHPFIILLIIGSVVPKKVIGLTNSIQDKPDFVSLRLDSFYGPSIVMRATVLCFL